MSEILKGRFDEDWSFGARLGLFWRAFVWLVRGYLLKPFLGKSGRVILIGSGVRIRMKSQLKAGNHFIIEDDADISCHSKQGISLGNKVTIGKGAIIRPTTLWGGPLGEGMRIGDHSNIGPMSYIGCSGFIDIGNHVMISPRVSIYAENHNFADPHTTMKSQGVTRSFVKIEDDCWIASHAVILAGVTIGRGSIVAAGSVVTKDVPPYSIVAGSPAKVISNRKQDV